MRVIPVGHRVLVQPDPVEEKSASGIVLAVGDTKKLEQNSQVIGTVLEIGEGAYKEFDSPWCKVGDRVLYQRYAGMKVPDGKGKYRDDLLVLNDLDITAVVLEE